MITPRQAFLTLEYDGKDISSDIRKDVENFTLTDISYDMISGGHEHEVR